MIRGLFIQLILIPLWVKGIRLHSQNYIKKASCFQHVEVDGFLILYELVMHFIL